MGEGVWTFSIVAHQRGLAKAQWSVVDTAAWLVKMTVAKDSFIVYVFAEGEV